MFCKSYGACNLTGEIIVIEIVWFTIIDTLKIHNGRTARDEHSILIKILLLDYLHEFFAESKLMDKSCFYSRGFCQHYNVKKF